MTIISFVEGAPVAKGGMGLVGVPMILRSVATRGHRVVLIMAGPPNPDREEFIVRNVRSAFQRRQGAGTFGIVSFKALATWAFAPSVLFEARRYVCDADFISLHSLYSFPVLVGYFLARLYRKPYAIWPHGVLAPFQRGVSRRKKWLYYRLFGKRILDNASVLFYSALGEREEVRGLGLRASSVVVPDGMNPDDYRNLPPRGRFRAKFLAGHNGELVVFLARLNAKKGLDLLIKSMALVLAAFSQARLAIVGPPDPPSFENQVKRWIRDCGIQSRTVVTGVISHQDKLELMADADVFVLPSEAENFGHSVFEAMASGIPVVVSDTLNYAREIVNAGAGFAAEREPANFADCVGSLLADPGLAKQMGANGKLFARGFSWEQTGRAVDVTLESILEHRPLPPNLLPVETLRT